jgi:lipopolysaccharide export system permease protein
VTITQYTHSKEQRKRTTIEAREAEYIPDYGWWLYTVTEIWYYPDGTPHEAKTFKKKHMPNYLETPSDILSAQYSRVSMMNYMDIIRTIKHTEPGTDYSRELRMELQSRLAYPFACFVFVLLAAPFGIFHTRAGMMKGVLTSISLCLFYYLVNAYLINLGREGYIMPFIAAWVANVVFLIVGGYLLHRMR